jgi:hypothetical protein
MKPPRSVANFAPGVRRSPHSSNATRCSCPRPSPKGGTFPEGGAARRFCPVAGEEGASSLSASPAFPQNAERRGQPGPRQPLHVHAPLDGVLAQARVFRPAQKIARVVLPGPSASGQPPSRQIRIQPPLNYIFLSSPRGLSEICRPIPSHKWLGYCQRPHYFLNRSGHEWPGYCQWLQYFFDHHGRAVSTACYGSPLTHRKPKSLLAPYGK